MSPLLVVNPLYIFIALALAGSIMLIFVGLASSSASEQVIERLDVYAGRPLTLEEIELSQPFSDRVIKPLINASAQFFSRFAPQRSVESLRRKLVMAGRPNNWGPAEFMGVRGLTGVIGAVLPLALLTITGAPLARRLLFTVVLGIFGFFAPVLWLGSRIRRRQTEIVKSLPDALDLLTISVEAGLGFDAAMNKVVEKWDNELSRAFERVIHEIRVGKLRREALRDMADSMDVSDVTSFVAAIIQADQLGVSIANILRIQSEQMRIRRRQRAEEKAHQAPIKMIFPMVFLIFPSLWVVLLGPSVLILIKSPFFQVI